MECVQLETVNTLLFCKIEAMDSTEVKVYTSGFLFSDLLSRSSSASYDAEGLLLGHESFSAVSNITDSQSSGQKKERKIVIQSCLHSNDLYSFYDNDAEVMSGSLKFKHKTVLGWYKVRRSTRATVSMKENTITRRMLNDPSLDRKRDVLFLLLTPHINDTSSTWSYPYKCFLFRKDSSPISTKINVTNLGENLSVAHYKDRSLLLSKNPDNQLNDVQQHCQPAFLDERGCIHQVKAICNVFQSAMGNLKELQQELSHTQSTIHHLEDDIQRFEAMVEDESLETDGDECDGQLSSPLETNAPNRVHFHPNDMKRDRRVPIKSKSPRRLYSKTTDL